MPRIRKPKDPQGTLRSPQGNSNSTEPVAYTFKIKIIQGKTYSFEFTDRTQARQFAASSMRFGLWVIEGDVETLIPPNWIEYAQIYPKREGEKTDGRSEEIIQ